MLPIKAIYFEKSPKNYILFKRLVPFHRFRISLWNELNPLTKRQKKREARLQFCTEVAWAEALGLHKFALLGLHLIYGSSEVARIKVADPKVLSILKAPDCDIKIKFIRSESSVEVNIVSSQGTIDRIYHYSLSLLCCQRELDYIRAGKFIKQTLKETKTLTTNTNEKTCPQETRSAPGPAPATQTVASPALTSAAVTQVIASPALTSAAVTEPEFPIITID